MTKEKKMADVNPRPVIRDLQPGDWIDLDQLGSDALMTYIKYPDIAIDDVFWPNWRGCGAQGAIADHFNARVDVSIEGGYTPESGMPVLVPNGLLKQLDQGWAFYSYALGKASDPAFRGPESLRTFCYVGKRPDKVSSLPVPQIKESHGCALDPDELDPAGATAVVPPYNAMSVGDTVILTWQGYYAGIPEDPFKQKKTIKADELGQPLTFTVPKAQFDYPVQDGELSYRIEYANGVGEPSDSEVQTLDLAKSDAKRLDPITVKGHEEGPINPGKYPDGLVLQVKPAYAALQEGDWVLVYWTGTDKTKNVIKALRVDRSTVDSGVIEFLIEPRWLIDNSNSKVAVVYQFARQGVAQSADTLPLDISKPLNLPMPVVENATSEGTDKGFLRANTSGDHVSIPATAEVGSGRVELHFEGNPNGGRHIALTPIPGNGKKYFIPATVLAANMSERLDVHFPVFYRVFAPGDNVGEKSATYNVRITPLPASRYPFTTSPQIVNNEMKLSSVGIGGADLEIHSSPPNDAWPFMAEGQLLIMEVHGVDRSGGSIRIFVREATHPVTAAEFRNKKATAKLPKAFLSTLKPNEPFTLKAKVSFNGGDSYINFVDSTPKLVS
jgi:hypothetical protein